MEHLLCFLHYTCRKLLSHSYSCNQDWWQPQTEGSTTQIRGHLPKELQKSQPSPYFLLFLNILFSVNRSLKNKVMEGPFRLFQVLPISSKFPHNNFWGHSILLHSGSIVPNLGFTSESSEVFLKIYQWPSLSPDKWNQNLQAVILTASRVITILQRMLRTTDTVQGQNPLFKRV